MVFTFVRDRLKYLRVVVNIQMLFTIIVTSKITCLNVPCSSRVFLEFQDMFRMLPGTPGHDIMNSVLLATHDSDGLCKCRVSSALSPWRRRLPPPSSAQHECPKCLNIRRMHLQTFECISRDTSMCFWIVMV